MTKTIRKGERRRDPRRTVDVNTTLTYKDLSIADCHTRDIGLGGAFVCTPTPPPPINAKVRLLLIRRDRAVPLALEGTVLNTTNQGAALQFRNISKEVNDVLVDILFSWQPPAAMRSTQPNIGREKELAWRK